MLKWTVSRSLSTASSTPHGPGGGKTTRRPFRDLSNTPPAGSSSSRSTPGVKRTPAKRKRCRSQGSDLRGYFQATKPSSRSGKRLSQRNSSSPVVVESFYQSTPRVDTDIGPLIPSRARYPVSCSNSVTLPTDPQTMLPPRGCGGASGAIFPAQQQPNKFQSHVSDFFQQISMATSPEDIIEFESLPFAHNSRRYALRNEERRRHCTPCLPPKLARITRLHARIKTPHHSATGAERCVDGELEDARQTPLAGKLLSLKLDANPAEENDTALPGTVSEYVVVVALSPPLSINWHGVTLIYYRDWSLGRKREANTSGAKSVAEILLGDSAERRKVLGSGARSEPEEEEEEEHIYETIDEGPAANVTLAMELDESKAAHNDSSVSSASQLLENPSPLSWQGSSDAKLAAGEFPLRRQRGIRRKRQARDKDGTAKSEVVQGKRPRREDDEDATDPETNLRAAHHSLTDAPMSAELRDPVPEGNRRRREAIMSTSTWDTDSLKSSLLDSFATSMTTTSAICTPEAPLVATVRRCLKYSPETPCPSAEYSGSSSRCSNASNCLAGSGGNGSGGGSNSRSSIEIACFAQNDRIHIRGDEKTVLILSVCRCFLWCAVIRCRDLRRAYEGPINAYVKASIKDPRSGEGCVKRTAVHRATPNPVFNESLVLPCPPAYDNHCAARQVSLDIAVWHRDRRARRSELLGCMTLPLPLSQDKEATWHPLEAGSGRNTSSAPAIYGMQQQDAVGGGGGRGSVVSPPLSNRDGAESIVTDNNNGSASGPTDDLTYLRHLELEPLDPLTGLPLHPGFTARGGRTPCTVTRRLVRPAGNQVPWGFSLSWGRPPRVERVDPGSPAERSGLRPGDYVVFVESSNVVTQPRDDILELIQAATSQLVLEVYRRGVHGHAVTSTASHRQSSANAVLQAPPALLPPTALGGAPVVTHPTIAFTAEPFPSLSADASPEEELGVREARHWSCLKNGQTRFMVPLTEHRDVLAASDYLILFQNLDELLKLSEELLDEGSGVDSYLCRVPRITATYRRYLSGLQRACCLLVALRKNAAFAKIVCEPAVPRRRKPDLTGVLLQPLDHYREMTRLLCQACPRNCQPVRDLAQGYREATANAAMMEPPRDTGRPLLSLQEVESRLVFARCKPFTLAVPGRQWLFGGALAKVEGRGRLQPTWALLLSDLLVFARISRDRVLFVTEEPLRLACIAEACFTIRKRPTEFRLQVTTQCGGTGGGVGVGGGCSPHGRPRRRVLILRAPSPELKAVWHNLLQRQM
ncbi:uncharacterized protein LOC106636519 [Copidosoma floridanum]|uniref:uncharacterized protein LOC106636519 n=1 Tax=Copidosoma floridanum TaxID=29053 RepID=UPI000C6FA31F|nr:uncharacterized protein LOC106636519 [Copidosoma floridanum]